MKRTATLAALLLFVLGAWAVFAFPAHHDTAWLLHVARRVLGGGRLYHDVVEINPPLIIWIAALPAAIGRVTGTWDMLVFRALVLVLAAITLLVAHRSLRALLPGGTAAADVLLLPLVYLLVTWPGLEFGQREHLAILLVLPYVLGGVRTVQAASNDGTRATRVLAGSAAAIGFALKPHFLLAWIACELVLAGYTRARSLRRTEHVALLASLALYGAAILLFARDYLALAAMAAPLYGGFARATPLAMLLAPPALTTAAVLIAWLSLRPRLAGIRPLGDVLAAMVAAFAMAVLVQAKGWGYHWIPSVTLALLLAGVMVLALAAQKTAWPRLATPAVLALTLLLAALSFGTHRQAQAQLERMAGGFYQLPAMLRLVEQHAGTGPIAALTIYMQTSFPLVSYTDVEWGLRFNSMWFLPGLYPPDGSAGARPFREIAAMDSTERYFFDAVVEDLVRNRPTLLLVDTRPPAAWLRGFSYLPYFAQDERLRALLASYRELPPVDRFRVLKRVE